MLIINNLFLPLDFDFENLKQAVIKKYKLNSATDVKLYRKSVDARRKDDIKFCCSVIIKCSNEEKVLKSLKNAALFDDKPYAFPDVKEKAEQRPVIIGFGPAGIFAAYYLSLAGLNPLILERGKPVEERVKDVESFFENGVLDENSNIQFGEGGAGTFSDGKLNTGIKDKRLRAILEIFVKFGANSDILTDAKPHIGTDILRKVIVNIRENIKANGGEVRFSATVTDILVENKKIKGVEINNSEKIYADRVILAIGHSARDTLSLIKHKDADMCRKPFSVGVRIEHLREDINKSLYGEFYKSEYLPAASYKLSYHNKENRGVYTFCMCPGGEVVNASNKNGGIAVNGMSFYKRDGENSNSAVLVTVEPDDLKGNNVLEGCAFQEKIEQAAYRVSKGAVPVECVGSFVFGKENKIGRVKPTVKPDCVLTDLGKLFPDFVKDLLKEGIKEFDKKIKGFADDDAILTAPETRSSSPVRIIRNENLMCDKIFGLFPAGEGAGYAGGIMSAAADGIKSAEALVKSYNKV